MNYFVILLGREFQSRPDELLVLAYIVAYFAVQYTNIYLSFERCLFSLVVKNSDSKKS